MSTAHDRPAVPAEQEALDRPWRRWASIGVIGFVFGSLVVGFWVVPESQVPGLDPWATICRSLGVPGYARSDAPPAPPPSPAVPVTNVSWTPASRSLLANASAERGSKIAAEICVACHGTDGVGIAPNYPNLTRQSAAAIYKQLQDYKSGVRTGVMAAVMAPMVQGLDEQQMADVAAYYASVPPRASRPASNVPREIVDLVKIGSPARALPPCDACHGVNMSGPEESPVLLGQSPTYFEEQLLAFARGERHNDIYGRMRVIARQLTPDEIRGLAAYYAPPAQMQ